MSFEHFSYSIIYIFLNFQEQRFLNLDETRNYAFIFQFLIETRYLPSFWRTLLGETAKQLW